MAGAARAHDAHSFEQMIHCRQQIVDMIQEWADEAEANKATIESVKAALDRLRV